MKARIDEIERAIAPFREGRIEVPDHGGRQGHHEARGGVREVIHRGKRIEVRTTYELSVDGEPLGVHLEVGTDGSVSCHGLPNYAFTSALGLAKRLVDLSMRELPADELGASQKEKV